jgi:hypothetical protein
MLQLGRRFELSQPQAFFEQLYKRITKRVRGPCSNSKRRWKSLPEINPMCGVGTSSSSQPRPISAKQRFDERSRSQIPWLGESQRGTLRKEFDISTDGWEYGPYNIMYTLQMGKSTRKMNTRTPTRPTTAATPTRPNTARVVQPITAMKRRGKSTAARSTAAVPRTEERDESLAGDHLGSLRARQRDGSSSNVMPYALEDRTSRATSAQPLSGSSGTPTRTCTLDWYEYERERTNQHAPDPVSSAFASGGTVAPTMHHTKSNRADRGGFGIARGARPARPSSKHRRPPSTYGLWRVVEVDKNPTQEYNYWSVFIDQCNKGGNRGTATT